MMKIIFALIISFIVLETATAWITSMSHVLKLRRVFRLRTESVRFSGEMPDAASEVAQKIAEKVAQDERDGKNEFLNFLRKVFDDLPINEAEELFLDDFCVFRDALAPGFFTTDELRSTFLAVTEGKEYATYEQFKEISKRLDEFGTDFSPEK